MVGVALAQPEEDAADVCGPLFTRTARRRGHQLVIFSAVQQPVCWMAYRPQAMRCAHWGMTYQGSRARFPETETRRFFSVSKVRLDADGQITEVLWSERSASSNMPVGAESMAPVSDVVDAIHGGAQVAAVVNAGLMRLPEHLFQVITHPLGSEGISLTATRPGATALSPALQGLALLPDTLPALRPTSRQGRRVQPAHRSFAVTQVALDPDGRVTGVLWGEVDAHENDWAGPQTKAPIADVVAALKEGGRVFALFPSTHGHLPDRQLTVVDYEDGRETVALLGPSTDDREIHNMQRLDA
jgi:hypothetical protein